MLQDVWDVLRTSLHSKLSPRLTRAHLGHRAPNAINQVFKIHQAEERLLLELVQLRGEGVLLVLQDGAWRVEETDGTLRAFRGPWSRCSIAVLLGLVKTSEFERKR